MSDHLSAPLRVLDLTDGLGRLAGRLLVGLGSDVIRLPRVDEPLDTPDALHWHVGQRVAPAAAREAVLDSLLATTDVVLESGDVADLVTPGLRVAEPDRWAHVVHVVVSPFGLTGPRARWGGDDLVVSAAGGMAWMGGDPDEAPQPPPREQAAQIAGNHAAIAALLGLIEQQSSGLGQLADVSAQQAVAATLETGAISWIHAGTVPTRTSGVYAHVAHRVFAAADGYLAGGYSGSNRMWDDLLAWMVEEGSAGDLIDPKWSDLVTRWEGRAEVDEVVARFAASRPARSFAEEARRRSLPWAEVLSPADLTSNPQLVDREFFVEVEGEEGTSSDVGFPFESPALPRPVRLPAPRLVDRTATWTVSTPAPATARTWRGRRTDERPLSGLRVLDLTWVLAGPYATKTLGEHGAEIIKIESMHRQDPTRFAPSMRLRPGASHNESGYFANFNRNKKSVALNLRTPEGLELLRDLVPHCDVVVENFSPGVLDRWGMGYSKLRAMQPDIVLASMAGTGQTGPWRSAVTFADTLAAMSGLTYETGGPGRPPHGLTFGLGDMVAANAAVLAILDLVRSGRGGHIDLSQLEAMTSHTGAAMLGAPHEVDRPGLHVIVPTVGLDRWIAISADPGTPLDSLADVLGVETAELNRDLAASLTRLLDADELAAHLQARGVASYPVQDGRDLLERDPQLAERGAYPVLRHALIGDVAHEGVVVALTRTPGRLTDPAPLIGEHTDQVLADLLELSPAQLVTLAHQGALS